jgi:hypothetical protein
MRTAVAVCLLVSMFAQEASAAGDPLSSLDFLLGHWRGGTPGSSGSDTFQRALDRHVLQRRSQSVSVASKEEPRASVQAELTVYPSGEGDSLAAIYFDNEGHVIHYNHVIVTPGQQVQFL